MPEIVKNAEIKFRIAGKAKPVKGVVVGFAPSLFGGPDLVVVKTGSKRERERS